MYRGVPFQILKDEEISRQIALAAHYGKNKVRRVFLADGDALVLPSFSCAENANDKLML